MAMFNITYLMFVIDKGRIMSLLLFPRKVVAQMLTACRYPTVT